LSGSGVLTLAALIAMGGRRYGFATADRRMR